MPRRRDPRRSIHVHTDVALFGQERRSGVDADANPNLFGRQRLRELGGRREGAGRGREGDKERVTLRVHLNTVMGGESLAQRSPMLSERLRVRVGPKLLQQPRRALHVREQERDRSGRKLAHSHSVNDG